MSNLLALKNRKKVIDTIYRASSAMKVAASMRVRKTENYENEFKASLSLLENHSSEILESLFLQFVMNVNANFHANILIGADSGMCGDFLNIVKNYFKSQKQNDNSNNKFWLVFGSKLELFCNNSDILYFGKISIESSDLFSNAEKLWNFFSENLINSLTIHYYMKNEIKQKTIFSKELLEAAYMENEYIKNKAVKNMKVDLDLISKDYGILYLAAHLYSSFVANIYEENKQRVIAMSQAKNNAESMGKIIDRLYNRARQEKITMELNEITAGII